MLMLPSYSVQGVGYLSLKVISSRFRPHSRAGSVGAVVGAVVGSVVGAVVGSVVGAVVGYVVGAVEGSVATVQVTLQVMTLSPQVTVTVAVPGPTAVIRPDSLTEATFSSLEA